MFFCNTCGSEIKIPVGICPVCGSPTPYDNASKPQAGRQPAAQNVVFEPEMPTTVIPPEDIPDLMQSEYGMMGGPSGSQSMGRPGGQPGASAMGRPGGQPGASAMGRPGGQPRTSSMGRPGGQPGTSAMGRPAGQPGTSAMGRPGGQPGTSAMGGPAGQQIPPVMGRTANRTGTSQTGRNTKQSGTSPSGGGRDNASTGGGNTGQAAPLRSGNGKDPSGEKQGLPWGKIILISLLVAGCLAGGFFGVRALLKKDEPKEKGRFGSEFGSRETTEAASVEKAGTIVIALDKNFLDRIGDVSGIKGTAEKGTEKKEFSFNEKGEAELELEEGTWKITVEAEGYQPYTFEQIVMVDAPVVMENFELTDTKGNLTLSLDAGILTDIEDTTEVSCVATKGKIEKEYSFASDGTLFLRLDPGDWNLRIECEDYDAYEMQVTAKAGEKTEQTVTLKPKDLARVQLSDLYMQKHPDYQDYSVRAFDYYDFTRNITFETTFNKKGKMKLELPAGDWLLVLGTKEHLKELRPEGGGYQFIEGMDDTFSTYENYNTYLISVTEETIRDKKVLDLVFPYSCYVEGYDEGILIVYADGSFRLGSRSSDTWSKGRFTDFEIKVNEQENTSNEQEIREYLHVIYSMKVESVESNSFGITAGKEYHIETESSHYRSLVDEYPGGGGSMHYLTEADGTWLFGMAAGQY